MKKPLLVSALTALFASCGDNSKECGPGTVEENGVCKPSVDCGPGTVADSSGTCVPDGSVVCSDGTVFDVASGTCVPSDDACGDGTVLIDGVCRDPATVTPDAEERAEPNDSTGAGQIMVPAIGDDGFVIHGCITPRNNGAQADYDPWLLSVNGPTVLEISADGVQGLAAGFVAFYGEDDEAMNDYVRFGINLSSDTAKRQIYLPVAGVYVLSITDQRTLLGLGAAGNESTCYYATIKQVALPAPIALTAGTDVNATDNGEVKVYRFTSNADGTIFKATITDNSNVLDPAWVATRAGAFHGLATYQGGWAPGPTRYIGAIDNGQSVDLIVDMEFNSSLTPVPFTISSYSVEASALPTDGGSVTVTKMNGLFPIDPIPYNPIQTINYYYFDVDADHPVVHFDAIESEKSVFVVFRTDIVDNNTGDIDVLAFKDQPETGGQTFSGEFVYFAKPGRYYVGLYQNGGAAGETYTMTSELIGQGAPTITASTTLEDEPIDEVTGSAFKTFDPGTAKWVEMTGGGTNLGTDEYLEVLYYPLDQEGWLDEEMVTDYFFDQVFSADGMDPAYGRITHNYPWAPFLVRFRSTGGPAADQTFDFAIAARTFTDLGTVTATTPVMMSDLNIPAGELIRFLVDASDSVTIETLNADFDAVIVRLDYDEYIFDGVDDVDGVGDETLSDQSPYLGYVAFAIFNAGPSDGTFDLSVSTDDSAN